MLGSIVGIEENIVLINLNIDLKKVTSLINLMVIMENEEKKIVGEIINIKDNIAYVNLLGEIQNDKFVYGVISKPSFASVIKLISKERISMIISTDEYKENQHLYLGTSPIYEGIKIITIGRLKKQKGYLRLIDCCSKLKNDGFNFEDNQITI